MQRLSWKWRRSSENDQLGALDVITPETRKQAASLVTSGVTVSLLVAHR